MTAHVIWIWENRYGAVEPERTGNNHRLQSEARFERLNLLRTFTQVSHSGHVSKLATDKLQTLATENESAASRPATLDVGLQQRQLPARLVHHSDHGVQYDSAAYRQHLGRGGTLQA